MKSTKFNFVYDRLLLKVLKIYRNISVYVLGLLFLGKRNIYFGSFKSTLKNSYVFQNTQAQLFFKKALFSKSESNNQSKKYQVR